MYTLRSYVLKLYKRKHLLFTTLLKSSDSLTQTVLHEYRYVICRYYILFEGVNKKVKVVPVRDNGICGTKEWLQSFLIATITEGQ
jgi:hypothetical protein